jgi:bifunctional non-homologous end joining protein LigD
VAKGAATVRISHAQNAPGGSVIAPYSPRVTPGATVSLPIEWDDLDDPALRPDAYTVRTAPALVGARGDAFRPIVGRRQSLPPLT